MAWRKAPPALVALFDSVVPGDPRVERRQMFGYPAVFAAGKLFAGLHQENFILKLSDADRARMQAEHGAQSFEPMPGRRMREYVVLPAAVLSDRKMLDSWLARSLAYVLSSAATSAKSRPTTTRRRAVAKRRPARDA